MALQKACSSTLHRCLAALLHSCVVATHDALQGSIPALTLPLILTIAAKVCKEFVFFPLITPFCLTYFT